MHRDPLTGNHSMTAERCARVEAFIEAHLGEEIDVSMLATAAGLSLFHFSRTFREAYGESPWRFVRRARVARAKVLLADVKYPVLRVGLEVGFVSASQFAQAFRDIVGMSPSRYRMLVSRSIGDAITDATRSGASR